MAELEKKLRVYKRNEKYQFWGNYDVVKNKEEQASMTSDFKLRTPIKLTSSLRSRSSSARFPDKKKYLYKNVPTMNTTTRIPLLPWEASKINKQMK